MRFRPRTGSEDRIVRDRSSLAGDHGGIFDGTVGWEDGGGHFDAEPGGYTFVKVTLFRPYSAGVGERAKGHQILARVGGPMFAIPPDGAQVHVSIPAGRILDPGAGVIIAWTIVSPENQFGGQVAKMDFGPDTTLVVKAKNVVLTDYENRFIGVGEKSGGIKAGNSDGSGWYIGDGKALIYAAVDNAGSPEAVATLALSENRVLVMCKEVGGAATNLRLDGDCTIACQKFMAVAASCSLGGAATFPAVHTLSTPSASVFIQG